MNALAQNCSCKEYRANKILKEELSGEEFSDEESSSDGFSRNLHYEQVRDQQKFTKFQPKIRMGRIR
jgi:hypothetical protein